MTKERYEVRPVMGPQGDCLVWEPVLLQTNSLAAAKAAAETAAATYQFGVGIEDSATGLIDVGGGWTATDNDPR